MKNETLSKYVLILSNFPWMQAYLRDDIFEDELEESSRNKEKKKSDKES